MIWDNGSYNPLSGSLELKKTEGEPEVFVISSGGNGTPIYRKLQRERQTICGRYIVYQ